MSGTNSRHQLQHPPSFLLRLLVTALITAALIGIFEAVKQWIYPDIAIWQSHTVTIIFGTIITTVAMFVGLRRYELLCQQLRSALVSQELARRRAESGRERVRESEEKYQALFDSIDEGFCVVEVMFDDADNALDYRFLEVNRVFEKQTGISNAVGRRMREIAPAHEEHWFKIYGEVALTGESRRFQNPAVALGRFYDVYAFRLGRPEQRQVAILFNDITERKRVEEELMAAYTFLDAIIENIPLMLFIKESRSLRFVRLNRAADALLGWSNETLKGKNAYDFWPKEQAEFFIEKDRETLNSRSVVDIPEEPIQTRHRGVRILHTKKVPILDTTGNPIYLLGISDDITERKRIEKEQRFLADVSVALSSSLEYEQTLVTMARLVVQNIADWCAVDVMDEQGQVSRLKVASADPNQAALCTVLEQMPPDRDLPRLVRSVIESKRPIVVEHVTPQYIESLAHAPGHLQALLATGTTSLVAVPLLMRERALGALVFTSSTTAHVYGQSDLRLAEALADRAAVAIENARLYRASVHATELRDQVLGVVAHDLRNPLSTILTQVWALKGQGPEAEPRSLRPVEVIHRAATRMNRLIQDLLDVALMEAGQLTIERARLSVSGLIVEAVEMQKQLASASSLELRVEVASDVPEIWGDRDRLLRVFENLIGNAIKFSEPGGRITASAAPIDDEVVFRVADTGSGIASENLPRVFDRFWQATKVGRKGAGLGLAITKGIVEAHGGRIWVESTVGRGSTFSFAIPKVFAAPQSLTGGRQSDRVA